MTASELKRKDTIEAAARVVCARLKRQGVKQPWKPVLEFLDGFDNPDSEEAKSAAVSHFMAGASSLAVTNNNDGLAIPTNEGKSDFKPVETSVFDEDAAPRSVIHRADLNPGGLAVSSPTNQTELIKREATNLGLTLTETDIQAIGSDLESRHGQLCTDTALIIEALKQWVALLEEQTKTEIDRLHAGLVETMASSHGRLTARVSSIFTTAKDQQQQYAVSQSQEMDKVYAFFASKGISIGQS